MKDGEDITFEEFLKKLGLTKERYLLAIRNTLKRDTLFLKRSPSEIRTNNYNAHLLQAWQANMDIQYVLDPYACATYILSYITKGQRGMSRLLEKHVKKQRQATKTLQIGLDISETNFSMQLKSVLNCKKQFILYCKFLFDDPLVMFNL